MRISRKKVFEYLSRCQDEKGGYTGRNIGELAKKLSVSIQALKKRIDGWTLTDPSFAGLKYLGTSLIPLTLEDISLIYGRLKRNPLEIKQDILADINRLRFDRGLMPIPKTTFYRIAEQYLKTISSSREELLWLDVMHIGVRDAYDIKEARKSLSHTFRYGGLKTFAGVDLESIQRRFEEAKKWFSQTYENADLRIWYFNSRQRNKKLRNHLSSIKSDENSAIQARLIFEAQVAFLVDCKDLLIEELIHKGGRIQQNMNDSRKKVENEILKKWIEQYSVIGWDVVNNSNEHNLGKLKEKLENSKSFADEVDVILIKRYRKDFDLIYDHLDRLTNHFSDNAIVPHDLVAELILDICRGNRLWKFLCEDECLKISKNKSLINELRLPNSPLKKAVLAKKLLNYVQSGKLTIPGSFKFQNVGEVIQSVELTDKDEMITKEDLEMLINGAYPIETPLEITQSSPLGDERENEKKIPLLEVLEEVSTLVVRHNPEWFESHREVFKRMSEHMFSMEYDESKFRERFYQAIGFLGRNFRYNDSPAFHGLQYFIQRYVSDASLDLEFRHLWKTYRDITGLKTSLILIDSMGIDSRRKSLFAKIHGRYRTIGFSDIRAVSSMLIPVFSSNYRSTDSEAINIVDIINHAYDLIGNDLKFCAGNSHTVSRVAAGLAFVDRKVILMGRNPYPPDKPGKICIRRLRENLDLLNKVGKLVREDGTYGRLIGSRKHVFVEGVNVCNLLRDTGKLVLWNEGQKNFQLDDLIQLVETSNRQKRLVRIVERGVTRVYEPNVSLMLKTSELILLMVGIMNIQRKRVEWQMSPISMENIALYIPA